MFSRRGLLQMIGAGGADLVLPVADATAAAKTYIYYISGKGSDGNDGLTPTTAFRTLQKAADLTNPGDTIYAMNGDYTKPGSGNQVLVVNRSGIQGGLVTYRNYPGHAPRIVVRPENWGGIKICASFIKIVGFEIEGDAASITYDYAYSQKDNPKNPATNATGIYVDGRTVGTLRKIFVGRNSIHHMPGGGIQVMAADYVTVSDNHVYSCCWWNVYANSGISIYSARHVDTNTINYKIIVRRNICYDNENYIPWLAKGGLHDGNGIIIDDNKNTQQTGVPAYVGRTLLENNLCYNNGGAGVEVYSSSRVDCVNNTAYCNNRCPVVDKGEVTTGDSTTVRLYNNILSARSGKRCQHYWRNIDVVYDYNIYHNGSVVVRGPNDIIADPLFISASMNPVNANFRLNLDSPGIDSGTATLAPVNDLVLNPRLIGSIDRGSYERLD